MSLGEIAVISGIAAITGFTGWFSLSLYSAFREHHRESEREAEELQVTHDLEDLKS